jgi:hypothetical protein
MKPDYDGTTGRKTRKPTDRPRPKWNNDVRFFICFRAGWVAAGGDSRAAQAFFDQWREEQNRLCVGRESSPQPLPPPAPGTHESDLAFEGRIPFASGSLTGPSTRNLEEWVAARNWSLIHRTEDMGL